MKVVGSIILALALLVSCKKQQDINACMSLDKATATVNELVTASNCGDELPSMVTITIDWGDGTTATSGQTGTHKYTLTGTFTIKLMANGSPLSEKIGTTDGVEKTITIN
jgi:hypothetical protein